MKSKWVVDQHGIRPKKKPRTRSDWATRDRLKKVSSHSTKLRSYPKE